MKKRVLATAMSLAALAASLPAIPAMADEEPAHIVLESLYFDAVPRDLQAVEDAINEITIPEINVEIELYPLGFMDAANQVGLLISSGEQLDLIVCANRSDYLSLVNKNMLLELSDLLEEYGQGIIETAPRAIPGGYVGDQLFGIPSVEKYGRTYGLCIAKEVVDAVGWDKFEDVTIDELGEFLAQAHELYPDKTLIQLSGGGNNVANFEYIYPVDYLGADAACGGIIGIGADEGDQIVNVFATEEYAYYCKKMREWYLAGYFNMDAATQTESNQSFVSTGNAFGYFIQTELDMVPGQAAANGVDMVGINTRGQKLVMGDIAAQTWSIPYTCENPEAAMKFMNMMWTNADLINLIYYGIEGLDYRFMDDGSGRVDYLEGESAQTVGYHQWFGLYGNLPLEYVWSSQPANLKEMREEFNNGIDEKDISRFFGYIFDPNSMKNQYTAVNSVLSTYRTSLECGVVDPETVLPEFISALETAGINEIIAENQKGLDAWIAEQEQE